MRFIKKNMAGVSLVEAILVLAIIAGIVAMGLRVYQGFITDAAAQRIKYNVEQILQAAAYYYYLNCENMPNDNSATLDPANYNNNTPPNPFQISVTQLVNAGYLESAPAPNPLVDSSANGGYLVQFNQLPNTVRQYCTTGGCNNIGYNVNWAIQVSVLLKNVNHANAYLGMTGADCLTTFNGNFNGAWTTVPCGSAGTFQSDCQTLWNAFYAAPSNPTNFANLASKGCPLVGSTYNNFIAWQRLPSLVSHRGQSPLWLTTPINRQYKQFIEMPSVTYMIANPTATYFKCGS